MALTTRQQGRAMERAFRKFDAMSAYGTAKRKRDYAPAAMLSAWEEYQRLAVQFGGTPVPPACGACGGQFRCICGVREA